MADKKYTPRLLKQYHDDVVPALMKEFGYDNPMQVPRLVKITVNKGVGEASQNKKRLDDAVHEIRSITGQHPVVAKARKSVSNFKLREGMPVGVFVTLRRTMMYDFLDRLVTLALPKVRDFRGVSDRSFDGRGNYTLGIREQIIFPEIDLDKVDNINGFDISFVTTATRDEEAFSLLRHLGMPFVRREESTTNLDTQSDG